MNAPIYLTVWSKAETAQPAADPSESLAAAVRAAILAGGTKFATATGACELSPIAPEFRWYLHGEHTWEFRKAADAVCVGEIHCVVASGLSRIYWRVYR